MKSIKVIAVFLIVASSFSSCKMMARTAAKYWTKKQIKAFVSNCEEKSAKFVGEEKAHQFCDCAVDQVAEKYREYEKVTEIPIMEVLKIANDCR